MAAAIDGGLGTAAMVALFGRADLLEGLEVGQVSSWWLGSRLPLLALAVGVLWPLLWELVDRGRTPGKRMVGIRVLRADGTPLGPRAVLVRNVLRLADGVPPPYAVGLASAAASANQQRLGDRAAGTVVVRDDRVPLGALQPNRAGLALILDETQPGLTWDTGGLTDTDRMVIRRFLDRRAALPVAARRSIGAELARRIRPKVIGPPDTFQPEQLLEHLVVRRRGG